MKKAVIAVIAAATGITTVIASVKMWKKNMIICNSRTIKEF